jgi:hypothetical protein
MAVGDQDRAAGLDRVGGSKQLVDGRDADDRTRGLWQRRSLRKPVAPRRIERRLSRGRKRQTPDKNENQSSGHGAFHSRT